MSAQHNIFLSILLNLSVLPPPETNASSGSAESTRRSSRRKNHNTSAPCIGHCFHAVFRPTSIINRIYKNIHWNYEEEYRIIKQDKPLNYKNGKYGIVAYSKIQVPLSCLIGITIGPLAHQDIVQQSLASYIEKIRGIYPLFKCKVYNSQIEIR